jgi:hypothetical protein
VAQELREYRRLVGLFRQLTNLRWPESGRCCASTRDGVPECCCRVLDGEELTFTVAEAALLAQRWRRDPMLVPRPDGMLVLDRSWWQPLLQSALARGVLVGTLESASHPTRPVLDGPRVTGVAVLMACNGPIALARYRAEGDRLRRWWQAAVDLVGVKAYYCTDHVRDDMVVVGESGETN